MPWIMNVFYILNPFLPVRLMDSISAMTGTNNAMNDFKGSHSAAKPASGAPKL
eukprot:NODE_14864_length_230_cov_1.066298_g13951_i0.p2 GENE.NODE_14864_length_230_cov_1.066298_g13951_i0~~NODE_14864_length_230_cov_1.066298_g13951_i0.p2  ORF type:complete len:53 (-),score=3.44 NODE_14864_length_230_cov_1.066298_g13951_i0:18-176(-)